MADDPRLTQSPRALRESTNDPEEFSKSEVNTTQRDSGDGAPEGQLYDVPTHKE
jgi:hypothetical protein